MADVEFQAGDALIIVDVQNDFLQGGSLAVPEGEQIIPVINTLIAQARLKQVPVFASRDWHPLDHCSFVTRGGQWPIHCVADTDGAELHGFLNLPADATIINKAMDKDKDVYSALQGFDTKGKQLADLLKAQNIQRAWICGLAFDYCVKATALDAQKAGIETKIILPATRAVNPDSGAQSKAELRAADVELFDYEF